MDDRLKNKCKHCLGVSENEIGEVVAWCEEYEHRNVTLGECFGNCEAQEEDEESENDVQTFSLD